MLLHGESRIFLSLTHTHSLSLSLSLSPSLPPLSASREGVTPECSYTVRNVTTIAEDAQGTPTQSHISPCILEYEEKALTPFKVFPPRSVARSANVKFAPECSDTVRAQSHIPPSILVYEENSLKPFELFPGVLLHGLAPYPLHPLSSVCTGYGRRNQSRGRVTPSSRSLLLLY